MTRIYSFLTLLCLYLFVSCTYNKHVEPLLEEAESLVQSSPDSAYRLLAALPVDSGGWSCGQVARYGLLLARATDKCMKPLLSCDSLLDVALEYYADNTPHRAMALLYKGRLEKEMGQQEEATRMFQEAWAILKDKSGEAEMKRLVLSSLGSQYLNGFLYVEAGRMYEECLDYCQTSQSKANVLSSLSVARFASGNKQEGVALQQQAMAYAEQSGDSALIARMEHNLSLKYYDLGKIDSAIWLTRDAIRHLPDESSSIGAYCGNLGRLLLENGAPDDTVSYYLSLGLEYASGALGRSSALLDMYDFEKYRGNYKAAIEFLEEHVELLDSMFVTENSTEIEQLMYEYNTRMKVQEERADGLRRLWTVGGLAMFVCFVFVLLYQKQSYKRKQEQTIYCKTMQQTHKQITLLQARVQENQAALATMKGEQDSLLKEREEKDCEIARREQMIRQLEQDIRRLRRWQFEQSTVYRKIRMLSQQTSEDKKNLKVLNNADRARLKQIVFEVCADYVTLCQKEYPKATEDDLLYLCLVDLGLDNRTIAFCFGFSDTHPINQRKLRLKERRTGQV